MKNTSSIPRYLHYTPTQLVLPRESSKNINATPAVLFQEHLLIHSIYKIHIDKDNCTGTREIWFGVRKSIQCDFVKGLLQANKKSLSNKVHKEMFYEAMLSSGSHSLCCFKRGYGSKKNHKIMFLVFFWAETLNVSWRVNDRRPA